MKWKAPANLISRLAAYTSSGRRTKKKKKKKERKEKPISMNPEIDPHKYFQFFFLQRSKRN
jgi:hypothetical protein